MTAQRQSCILPARRAGGRFARLPDFAFTPRLRLCLAGCLFLILLQLPLSAQAAEESLTELDLSQGAITLSADGIRGWDAAGNEVTALNQFGYRLTGSLNSDLLTSGITVTGGRHRLELQGCLISLTAADSAALQITGDASLTLILAKDSLNTFSAAAAAVQFGRGLLSACDAALTIQGEGGLTLQCSAGSAVVTSKGSNDRQHLSIEGGRIDLIGDGNKANGFQGNGSGGGSDFTMSDGSVTAAANISTGISNYQRFRISGGSLRASTNCLATAAAPNETMALYRRVLTGLPKASSVDFLAVCSAGSVYPYHYAFTRTSATEASGYLYLWLPLGQSEIILRAGGQTYRLNTAFRSELSTSHAMTAVAEPLLHVSASATDLFRNSLAAAPEAAAVYTQTHPCNTEFCLTAEGERFWYWYDSLNRRVVSLQPTYRATLYRDTFLQAVEKPSGEPFRVVFLALDGQIIATKTAVAGSVDAPAQIPHYYGYRFAAWSQDLRQISDHTLLEAQYSRVAGPFAVAVTNNGEITTAGGPTLYPYAAGVSATAAAAVAGQVFAGWQANGQIVSYQNPYRFIVSHAVLLTPLYAVAAPSPLPLVSLPFLQRDTGDSAAAAEPLHLITEYEIPAGFTPLECGVLLTFSAAEPNPADLFPGSAAVQFQRSHTPNTAGGTYIVSTSAMPTETLYARSYLICLDSAGTEQTVFSAMVCSPAHGLE
ncbi:MAG: carbohydrate-binding domain-containing protein [Negativicutes bacterium]|nr:carbohydrate-binding domain-containing protein [Negativicutes bacterium]